MTDNQPPEPCSVQSFPNERETPVKRLATITAGVLVALAITTPASASLPPGAYVPRGCPIADTYATGLTADWPVYCDVRTYTVHRGDTLTKIARKEYDPKQPKAAGRLWRDIYSYNHLRSTRLRVGQVLQIPIEDF